MLTDMEKKSLLFNTFLNTLRMELTLNQNYPDQAFEKKIRHFVERRKERADQESTTKRKDPSKEEESQGETRERKEITEIIIVEPICGTTALLILRKKEEEETSKEVSKGIMEDLMLIALTLLEPMPKVTPMIETLHH